MPQKGRSNLLFKIMNVFQADSHKAEAFIIYIAAWHPFVHNIQHIPLQNIQHIPLQKTGYTLFHQRNKLMDGKTLNTTYDMHTNTSFLNFFKNKLSSFAYFYFQNTSFTHFIATARLHMK